MSTVTKRDLNQKTSEVLQRVTERGEIIVTERGKPRWRVTSYSDEGDVLARAQRQGRYTAPATRPIPWPDSAAGPHYDAAEVDALISEIKGEY